jgi:hypothetical protein
VESSPAKITSNHFFLAYEQQSIAFLRFSSLDNHLVLSKMSEIDENKIIFLNHN